MPGVGVRAGWQERHKTLARLQRTTATVRGSGCQAGQGGDYAALMSAATPGRVLPSIHSRKAPPAVET
jgi:hypothetical protein